MANVTVTDAETIWSPASTGVETSAAARSTLPYAPFLTDKARRGLEGRRGLLERIEGWASEYRRDAPLVWFHAPSVGEGLQTRPVIAAQMSRRSG